MFKKYFKGIRGISPRFAIVGVLVAVVAISGLALLLTRGGSEAKADSMRPRAARLERVEGSVGISRAEEQDRQVEWAEATVNTPVSVGERIYAREGSSASIELTGHDYVRLNESTSLDILALEDSRTQLAIRSGSALFDVGALAPGQLYEVATPCGAVDFKEPGLYQVGLDGNNAVISVLSGLAQVVGLEGSGSINKGEVFTLTGATATDALTSSLAPDLAGDIVDDYYRYRYPRVYDGRYRSYDTYLADPDYYDPYRTSVSCQYLPADIPGLYDLDYYGDWVNLNDYGYCWAPRVSAGWAPFRSGFWDLDDWWGPSWVSYEPWGWAPYHYGRWSFVNERWFWVPYEVRTQPLYCPAPVAFVTLTDQIGWVPLAPGEVYVPRYYDVNFTPQYLASPELINAATVQTTFVNLNAPGAVTVVPVRAFSYAISPSLITTADPRMIAKSRTVLDPFSVDGVKALATRRDDARRKFEFSGGEQEVLNKTVVTSTMPAASPVRGNIAKDFRLETAPKQSRDNKLKITDATQVTTLHRRDGLPQPLAQSQQMNELATRAEKGDRSARQEMRQLMRQEERAANLKSANQPAAQPPVAQQRVQQEQLRQQAKQQRRAERQQQAGAPERQAQQQQLKQQRKAEQRQQAAAAAQQQEAARRGAREQARQQGQLRQQQQMRQQRKEQTPPRRKPPQNLPQQQARRFERVQRTQQEAAQRAQIGRQQELLKAQRRAGQQRQTTMQQQAARGQAMQRQAVQQQAARAQAMQRQAVQQQAARAQAMQRQAVQQQAARAQAMQRQAPSPSMQRAPAYVGPPQRQSAGGPQGQKPERGRHNPPQ